MVVDLTDVSAIDGSGVGAISHLFKQATASGRQFTLRGATGQPLHMLTDLGLAGLFGLPLSKPARAVRRPVFAMFTRGAAAVSN